MDFHPLYAQARPFAMHSSPTIVITGATSGLGRIAAVQLARQGAHLVLIARDANKAAATRAAILTAQPAAQVDVHYADFARMADVARVGTEIAGQYPRIDVLINNAGLHAFEQRVTVDGYAEMVAVNYLAPWLLTDLLRDKLIASAPGRIVTVASEASRRHGGFLVERDLDDVAPFSRLGSSKVYARTKLMNIMFSMELAWQLQTTGVTVNCLDPGFNVTSLGRELGFASILARVLTACHIGDPRRGAGIIVRLATDPAFGRTTGGYFAVGDTRPLTPVAPAGDVSVQRELWSATAALLRTAHAVR